MKFFGSSVTYFDSSLLEFLRNFWPQWASSGGRQTKSLWKKTNFETKRNEFEDFLQREFSLVGSALMGTTRPEHLVFFAKKRMVISLVVPEIEGPMSRG